MRPFPVALPFGAFDQLWMSQVIWPSASSLVTGHCKVKCTQSSDLMKLFPDSSLKTYEIEIE